VPVPERAASRPAVSQQVLVLVPVRGRAASQREPETEHRSILREALLGIPYLDLGLDEVQDLERDREQQFQDLE
jgi:plasmid stability protein